jgi:hypothetical protein
MERYDFDEETTATLRSVELQNPGSVRSWRVGEYEVPFSVYDSDGLRLLSGALSLSLDIVRKCAGGPITASETSDFTKRLTQNLMRIFDSGERNSKVLMLAALVGV